MTIAGPTNAGLAAAPLTPDAMSTAPKTILEVLTDGSLARICADLSEMSGLAVELREENGRAIVPCSGPRAWELADAKVSGGEEFPIRLGERTVGAFVLGPGGQAMRARVAGLLKQLANATSDFFSNEAELRHRVREMGALYRLSSLLARAANIERVLEVALESALDVLELDAGSLVLLREDADGIISKTEEDLTLMASRNLSRVWLQDPHALSKDRIFDQLALSGDVVTVEDLRADPRVQIPDLVLEEGVVAFINAGLIFQGRPIGVIRLYAKRPRAFTDSDIRLIRSVAQQAAVAVQQTRLLKHREEERRIQRQLQLAADVQRRMLPRSVPRVPGLDIAARYLPSFELGGDFYDFIELSGNLGLSIGDVVGKGVAAALLMSAVKASIRAHAQQVYDLDEVIGRVNAALCRDTLDMEFATLWYGVLEPKTLRLTYCSAGHDPAMVVRVPQHRAPTTADIDELSVGGMVVGVDPSQRYQRAVFDLRPRDVLIMYTDGVTDAANFSGQKWGKKRLRESILKVLGQKPDATAAAIIESVYWDVRQFSGLATRTDDQTMVVLRVNEIAR